jgi:hypothetical protein
LQDDVDNPAAHRTPATWRCLDLALLSAVGKHRLTRRKAHSHAKPFGFPDDAAWSLGLPQNFVLLNYSLVKVIASGKAIHLAALQSHLIEHFFDFLQRLEGTKQTSSNFTACCVKAIDAKALMKRVGTKLVQPKR